MKLTEQKKIQKKVDDEGWEENINFSKKIRHQETELNTKQVETAVKYKNFNTVEKLVTKTVQELGKVFSTMKISEPNLNIKSNNQVICDTESTKNEQKVSENEKLKKVQKNSKEDKISRDAIFNVAVEKSRCGRNTVVKFRSWREMIQFSLYTLIQQVDIGNLDLQYIILAAKKRTGNKILEIISKKNPEIRGIASNGETSAFEDVVEIEEGLHILVVTIGRLLNMLNKNKMLFKNKNTKLVIYEADKFIPVEYLERLFKTLEYSQVEIFSEDFSEDLMSVIKDCVVDYDLINSEDTHLKLEGSNESIGVSHLYTIVDDKYKFVCLKHVLKILDPIRAVIYCNSISSVKNIAENLGERALFIHSGMAIHVKNMICENMSPDIKYVVCNDIYPSNSEIDGVNLVINVDVPRASQQYNNRIVNIGKIDTVITFIKENQSQKISEIENLLCCKFSPFTGETMKKKE